MGAMIVGRDVRRPLAAERIERMDAARAVARERARLSGLLVR